MRANRSLTLPYIFHLAAVPAVIGTTLSGLYLWEVLASQSRQPTRLAAIAALVLLPALAIYAWKIAACARKVNEALAGNGDVCTAASECFRRMLRSSMVMWPTSAIVFAIAATWFILPTALGAQYFAVAGLITAAPALAWSEWTSKRLLLRATHSASELGYRGEFQSFTVKIARLFGPIYLVATVALIHLVSARVATTIESLAISQIEAVAETVWSQTAPTTPSTLAAIQSALPKGTSLHLIDTAGNVSSSTGEALAADEVAAIRRIRTGSSLQFVGPHVSLFRELAPGSILVISTPWKRYQGVTAQIALYAATIGALTLLLFWFGAHLDIRRPFNELMSAASEIASGNFDYPMRVFSDGEAGQLAARFDETRRNLRGLLSHISGNASSVAAGVMAIRGGTESLLQKAKEQAQLTHASNESVTVVREHSEMVLKQIESVSEVAVDTASRSIQLNAAAQEIARMVDGLFESVDCISSSSAQITAAATQMTHRSGALAGIGKDVLALVSEMDHTVVGIQETAARTAEIGRTVSAEAKSGGAAVHDVVEGTARARELTQTTSDVLAELQQSAEEVQRIIAVIEDVASRTNLLSLNAAIIAAQAGGNGMGFGVVAEEIRALADRTRVSTKEIARIIALVRTRSAEAVRAMAEASQRVVTNGALAERASMTLERIMVVADQSARESAMMSSSLKEQTVSVRHLHEATSMTFAHIEDIDRGMQEQSKAIASVAESVERVRDLSFRVQKSTEEQTSSAGGITERMETVSFQIRDIIGAMQRQMDEAKRMAHAWSTVSEIASQNDEVAMSFGTVVGNLAVTGEHFAAELARFRYES